MADESRIHVLNNGRSPMKRGGDYITRSQAEQMVLAERAENERMVQWYMHQIPELVAKMLGDALAANGLTMQGPPAPDSQPDVHGDGQGDPS